ncbi:Aldose reductase [Hypsibius exemplaris]|uniref:Aldose reductase n=1 Tax=Hypsibius exemplaris TaxID=2072580 RepID=A0A1W0WMP1_HYPEX|nr:Aldose reductase [Hypsibius exemplaris]
MAPSVPTVKLPAGTPLPVIGLGTWKSSPGQVGQAVKDAIDLGYRHFDCAFIYQNEDEIGAAFAEKIKEGVVKREDLFVTSKIWNTFHSNQKVHEAIDKTLAALRFEYLDLLLIHWPFGYKEGGDLFPKDANDKMAHTDVDYVETWKALEEVHKAGKAKNIGLSNFNVEQVQRVVENSTVAPACHQIEVHVYLQNKKLIDFSKSKGMVVVAYSPLGSNDRPKGPGFGDFPAPLEDAVVKKIAAKHKKQPGHVLLKFLLQQDLVVIPKSVSKERLKANLEVFDFTLDNEDLNELQKLDKHGEYRACTMGQDNSHIYYPFDRKYDSSS